MITVYLSNRNLRIVDGSLSAGKMRLRGLYCSVDVGESILNGVIMEEDAVRKQLRQLWHANHLPRRGVRLVLDSTQFNVKLMDVPLQSSQKTMQFVSREFNEINRIEDPVISFFPMPGQRHNRMQRVLATMTSRAYLQSYLDLFKSIGVHLDMIVSAQAAASLLINRTQRQREGTYIVQIVEDIMLTNILVSNGRQVYFNRTRLFAEPRSTEFVLEVARSVLRLIPFAKAQNLQAAVNQVLIAGLEDADFSFYRDSVRQTDEGLRVDVLPLPLSSSAQPPKGENMTHFALPLGGLYLHPGKTSLLTQMRLTRQQEKPERRKALRVAIPLLIATAASLVAVVMLSSRNANLQKQLEKMQAYNSDPQIQADCDRYDQLENDILVLRRMQAGCERLQEQVLAYPLVNSQIDQILAECAQNLVSTRISGYQAATGVLSFETTASSAEQISQFVQRLEQQPSFSAVHYEGYTQVDEKTWQVHVICTLSGRGEEHDEADTEDYGTR